MQQFFKELRRSSSMKVFGIAFLILVLLIPIAMTRGVVNDRILIAEAARQDIMRSWGQPQIIGGPILVLHVGIVGLGLGCLGQLPERTSTVAALLQSQRQHLMHSRLLRRGQ